MSDEWQGGLFKLVADYGTSKRWLQSSNERTLRMFGKDHHQSAKIKPELTLLAPDGSVIATMDHWAYEWKEADKGAA